jgi:hypothetical protein
MAHIRSLELLRDEMRVRQGKVHTTLEGAGLAGDCYVIQDREFLFFTECGMRIHYRVGEGITVERAEQSTDESQNLYVYGTTYAAVASLNGLYPMHASAVVWNDRVFAFSGAAFSGKSTIVAQLCRMGFPLLCDDTLILDLSEPNQAIGLPGGTAIKLWPDAVDLTGATPGRRVWPDEHKIYATPAGSSEHRPLPVAEIIYLDFGAESAITPLAGGDRLSALQDDHYTTEIYLQASGLGGQQRFAQLLQLSQAMRLSRFTRPRDLRTFAATTEMIADHIRRRAGA